MFFVFVVGLPATSHATSITASWNPNPEADIAGYRLSYGTASRSYTTTIDVGNATSYSLSVTGGLTYYFALQAYDTMGYVSGYSAEVAVLVPLPSAPTISGISPSGGTAGTSVTIGGANFGTTKGTSTVTFNGVAATPTSWSATSIVVPVPSGASSGNVVATIAGVSSNGMAFTVYSASSSVSSNLSGAWQNQDVGAVGQAGSSSSSNGVFTVRGAGADIWGSADAFQFVYQTLSGDGQIVARVTSVQNTSVNAKAGVMVRDTLAADSANVMIDVAPNGNIEFMARGAAGASTAWLSGTTRVPPVWLRLTRSGSTITGAASADGITWTTVGSTSIGLGTVADVGMVVSSHDTSQLNTSTFDHVVVAGSLPAPWQQDDVGAVGQAGSSSGSDGVFTIRGAGADIWGTADAFQFAHQPLAGDGQIVARVTSVQNTSINAKAGVMLRDTLAAGSANVMLDVAPNGNIEFMARGTANGSTTWLAGATRVPPVWLRLTRSGSTVTGAVSADGSSWTQVGSTTIALAATVEAGFVVSSHTTSQLNTSTFDQIDVSTGGGDGLSESWQSQDVGAVGPAGSTSYSSGVFTVRGAGADIWGSADAFQFAYHPLNGDGQIVARLTSMQDTSDYAKAGIMLRDTLGAGSANVMLDVKPNGEVEFMGRGMTDSATSWFGGTARSGPVWLRLTRSGSTIAGAVSSDGTTWTPLGSVTVGFGATVDAGLVVCSHTTSQLNTSTFDNVK